ncbi:GNAT family N-acetyltransferase [Pantoea sp. RRHST58]|uniref:GNAT family N-acetyltransferase n=1 Tax=Pantoea sp. RRHST58 TaxID=3425183 RepID=UPI003DA0648F
METVKLKIIRFSPQMPLNVENFNCGRPALNEFLQKHLAAQHRQNVLKAYLLVTDDPVPEVMGYYTLSGGSYARAAVTRAFQKQAAPYHETVCIIIGRLAVDQRIAGKGFGTQLVLDALRVAYAAADAVGIYAVMVEAKDDQAAGFYREAMRFIPLKTEDGKLKFFFPVASIAPLL